ncbi:sortase domain-containing protein [Streptomyces phaeoluteigriseus]
MSRVLTPLSQTCGGRFEGPNTDAVGRSAGAVGRAQVRGRGRALVPWTSATQQRGQEGNFALAGHRDTHGEPFRRLDLLKPRDTVVVETADATYTYAVDVVLARTWPHDTGVIRPVPRSLAVPHHGYDDPGHYLTLTICTPEYSSRYRLVVWGKLIEVRGRAA